MSKDSTTLVELLLEKLKPIEGISSKKMFGGYGVFHDNKMFGIVSAKGQCYLKVSDATKTAYEDNGAEKHSRMPYYSIPEAIMNDNKLLEVWAKTSIEASK